MHLLCIYYVQKVISCNLSINLKSNDPVWCANLKPEKLSTEPVNAM